MTGFGWFGGACLVAGTTIGATVLVLIGSVVGFNFPHVLFLYFFAWAIMMLTGLMLGEVCMKLPKGHSFLSITGHYWGSWGQWVSSLIFYLLMFFLLCSYYSILGKTSMVIVDHQHIISGLMPSQLVLFWSSIMAVGLYFGREMLKRANSVFVLIMIVTFLVLLGAVIPFARFEQVIQLPELKTGIIDSAISLLFIINAFGFHIILPSVRNLLGDNQSKDMVRSILIGSAIPLCLYILWFVISVSLLPAAFLNGPILQVPMDQVSVFVTEIIKKATQSDLVYDLLFILHFTFVITSVIGISLSLFDLLADLFGKLKLRLANWVGCLLATFPSAIFTIIDQRGVRFFLAFAGILVIILNIIMPALFLLQERHERAGLSRFALISNPLAYFCIFIGVALLPITIYYL